MRSIPRFSPLPSLTICPYPFRLIAILALVLAWSGHLQAAIPPAGSIDDQFQTCNELAAAGNSEQAIPCYERLIETAGYSPGVLFNLGNSYYETGNMGKAILNYERALRLSPGDSDIRANLQQARKHQGLFSPEADRLQQITELLNLSQWSILGLVGFTLVVLGGCFILRFPQARRTGRLLLPVGLLLLLPSIFGAAIQFRKYNPSIVLEDDTFLQISPFEGARQVGSLKAGAQIFIDDRHTNYLKVHDSSGRRGWVESVKVESVVPERRTASVRTS